MLLCRKKGLTKSMEVKWESSRNRRRRKKRKKQLGSGLEWKFVLTQCCGFLVMWTTLVSPLWFDFGAVRRIWFGLAVIRGHLSVNPLGGFDLVE